MMKGPSAFLWAAGFCGLILGEAQDVSLPQREDQCLMVLKNRKLPVKLETRGKPRRAKWEQVDQVLTGLREELQGLACEFRFDSVFTTKEDVLYIPLTNNLVRTVPAAALEGLAIFGQSGQAMGEYESRVTYDRSGGLYAKKSYTLHYFSFKDTRGQLQSTGNRLLLDDFLVRWRDVSDRVVINTLNEMSK
jgi:hypothetical protein